MRKLLWTFLTILVFPLSAQVLVSGPWEDELWRPRLEGNRTNQEVQTLFKESEKQALELEPGIHRTLALARLGHIRATWYLDQSNPQQAEKELEGAESLLLPLLALKDARVLGLMAEIRSGFLSIRGLPYIMGNAGDIEKLALEALSLDPKHPGATIVYAFGKINAPALFGGDPDMGIRLLEPLVLRSDILSYYRQVALFGLIQAWEKKGDKVQRSRWVQSARNQYPTNKDFAKLAL